MLTLCMLVRDQAKSLEKILKNCVEVVDDIIIVNNKSKDHTSDIIHKYGAKELLYLEDTWDEGRNAYVEAVKGGWLLVLDADEWITKQNLLKIKDIIALTPENILAYKIPRIDFLGNGKWAEILHNRLFRKHPQIFYDKNKVHSTISNSILKNVEYTKVSYKVNFIHWDGLIPPKNTIFKEKRSIYVESLRKKIQLGENVFESLYRLSLEYIAVYDYENGKKLLEASLKHRCSNPIYLNRPRLYLALLESELGNFEDAEKLLLTLLEHCHSKWELAYINTYLSKLYFRSRDSRALLYAQNALSLLPESPVCSLNYSLVCCDSHIADKYYSKALQILPFLSDDRIYLDGDKHSIFQIQSMTLLDKVSNVDAWKKRQWKK